MSGVFKDAKGIAAAEGGLQEAAAGFPEKAVVGCAAEKGELAEAAVFSETAAVGCAAEKGSAPEVMPGHPLTGKDLPDTATDPFGAEGNLLEAAADFSGEEGSAERVPSAEEFRERAKQIAADVLERLGEIALDPESSAQHAIAAGKAVIEYGYGKPGIDRGSEGTAGLDRVDELLESIAAAARD